MAIEKRTHTGWYVRMPLDEPQDRSDLVVELRLEADFEIEHLYPSEEEAWAAARAYLAEQRDQALKDIAFLSNPYTSPSGITYICPQEKIDAWKVEAHKMGPAPKREPVSAGKRGREVAAGRWAQGTAQLGAVFLNAE